MTRESAASLVFASHTGIPGESIFSGVNSTAMRTRAATNGFSQNILEGSL